MKKMEKLRAFIETADSPTFIQIQSNPEFVKAVKRYKWTIELIKGAKPFVVYRPVNASTKLTPRTINAFIGRISPILNKMDLNLKAVECGINYGGKYYPRVIVADGYSNLISGSHAVYMHLMQEYSPAKSKVK